MGLLSQGWTQPHRPVNWVEQGTQNRPDGVVWGRFDWVKPVRCSAKLVSDVEFAPLDPTRKTLILQISSRGLWSQQEHRNDGQHHQACSEGESTGERQCRDQVRDEYQRPDAGRVAGNGRGPYTFGGAQICRIEI